MPRSRYHRRMARFRRATTPGATYFFTVNTYQRRRVLTDARVYDALKRSIRDVKTRLPFAIEAFVLLPDHPHCIWTLPTSDADYAKRWNLIKRLTSQRTRDLFAQPVNTSRLKRAELGLWQRRFWEHQIRDERDFERHADYIHWNPVKHGYVKIVALWPYSSFHHHVRRGVYPVDWAGDAEDGDGGRCFGEPREDE